MSNINAYICCPPPLKSKSANMQKRHCFKINAFFDMLKINMLNHLNFKLKSNMC